MLLFAHSDDNYMMRSERRASYNRAPRRRRRRPGGFIYGLVAIIVSIIIWPLGMAMLWARRLKWSAGVKLIASALTLILCMCWIGFALTVQTGDSRITYIQDKVNAFLADSAGVVTEKGEKLADDVTTAGGELLAYASDNLPAAAEWVNDTIHAGWEAVAGLFGGENDDRIAPVDADVTATPEPSNAPEPDVTPEITDEPTPTPGPQITPEAAADVPTDEPTEEPTDEPTEEPAEAPTDEPTEEPTEEPAPTDEPVKVAAGTPAPARVTAQPTQLNIEADPTPAPTVKPAGQATVYHSSNGKCYHMAANCIGMTGAPAYTLEDSISAGFRSCGNCGSPAADILSEEETVVWLDESNIYHTSDECPNFSGVWSLVTITDACAADAAACSACGASSYAPENGRIAEITSPEPTAEPTAEPTEEPTEAPTAEPTAESIEEPTEEPTAEPTEEPTAEPTEEPMPAPTIDVSALPAVKSAGEATVYYTTNGVAYHRAATCVGMSGAKEHTLSEAVSAGYRACGNCQVPAEELLSADEPVMWVDETSVFHATDECAQFNGEWTLMTITDAYAAGCTPCAVCCMAGDYAVPEATPEPTAGPTPVPVEAGAPAHKSAGEAIVYHTSNGRSYHVAERCGSMSGAKPYTLAESIADGYGPCGICAVPDPDILDMPVVWLDASGIGHVSDECAHFEGRYTLMSIYDACSENVSGCPYCGGESYIAENRARLMELAKSVTVYYNDGSTYYHAADSCKGMPTADAHTLYDAIEKGLEWCHNCEPVKLGDLDSE